MDGILKTGGVGETSGGALAPRERPSSPEAWLRNLFAFVRRPPPIYVAFLLVVVAAITVVEAAYLTAPMPPGTDSGHWITTSYAYIGRAHPSDFTDQAGLYPPVTFLLVGTVVLAVGSPTTAGFALGGLLLLIYGLTTIHLARRYLGSREGQLLFVGLAVLNGTTLQMLFWGGYPNFLAFSILNEAMIFLLAFVRTRGTWEGVAFWSLAALLYLTHDLSFAIFLAAGSLTLVLLLLTDPGIWRLLRSRGMLLGVALFAIVVASYLGITDALGIAHPGYLFTNPATYVVDPIGLLFRPFYFAPAFWPKGGRVYLSGAATLALLIVPALALLAVVAGSAWARRGSVPRRAQIVSGWFAATLLVPAAGYLAHVDTDYTRFAYFLPLPTALGACLLAEVAIARGRERAARSTSAPGGTTPLGPPPLTRPTRLAVWGVVGVALLALFAAVTVPTVGQNEGQNTSPAHQADFVAAMNWLNQHGRPGAVITDTSDAQRWLEAMTARNGYASTSSWLHFYTEQILDNDLTYWALNGEYVTTDNLGAFAFSGANATLLDASPQYAEYVEGIPFPLLRLSMASLAVTSATGNASASTTTSAQWGPPVFALWHAPVPGSPADLRSYVSALYTTPVFQVNVTAFLDGTGGLAPGDGAINVTAVPSNGTRLTQVTFDLRSPVASVLGGTGNFLGFHYAGGRSFSASESGAEGSLPGSKVVSATGSLSVTPDPTRSFATPRAVPTTLVLSFDPGPGRFSVQIQLEASGLSNPAVTLPPLLSSPSFLAANQVHYLLAQNVSLEAPSVALFEQEFGYSVVFENAEWEVLAG